MDSVGRLNTNCCFSVKAEEMEDLLCKNHGAASPRCSWCWTCPRSSYKQAAAGRDSMFMDGLYSSNRHMSICCEGLRIAGAGTVKKRKQHSRASGSSRVI
ncbi:Hypothetical predicted protein [Xyrichtys novacula]|uniref:Uncharacterized protein n=1 Tax=Xyrichtys novacula TaxID=13765 RepID=A0AAV1F184_XYRNO|nr:Hypothetical predicted protein [Xyrichtys novacula]